eukprot:52851_1
MGNTTTYVIGENEHGELGLGHQQKVHQLTKVKDQRPHNIYSGNKFTIFSDKYHQKMYVVGSDQWGETGTTCTALLNPTLITFFAEKRIKIKKVCVNTNARATFWIDDLGNVYGGGCIFKYILFCNFIIIISKQLFLTYVYNGDIYELCGKSIDNNWWNRLVVVLFVVKECCTNICYNTGIIVGIKELIFMDKQKGVVIWIKVGDKKHEVDGKYAANAKKV